MIKNLGEILFNKAKSVNDKIDNEKIEELYSIATDRAKTAASHGNFSVNVTVNTREYDDRCPFFDFTYDSSSLMDKVVPEVMKRLNNEHIRTVLNRSPKDQVSHWIMTLNFGANDIVDDDYEIKLHPIPHEI
jgi:hypothetical protein